MTVADLDQSSTLLLGLVCVWLGLECSHKGGKEALCPAPATPGVKDTASSDSSDCREIEEGGYKPSMSARNLQSKSL